MRAEGWVVVGVGSDSVAGVEVVAPMAVEVVTVEEEGVAAEMAAAEWAEVGDTACEHNGDVTARFTAVITDFVLFPR